MNFRVKYLIAGMAPAIELYDKLKAELEGEGRCIICDVCEAEVLGECPSLSDSRLYPVVPVTFMFNTHGFEPRRTILFDIFVLMDNLRSGEFEATRVGIEEIVIDGVHFDFPENYRIGELPVEEI